MTAQGAARADGLWAITSYFNPTGSGRRLSNFRTFRARLNAPLVAVELAYAPDFELQQDDADILVRLRGGAVLWQKERLLNLALRTLPDGCRKVAWVDCDVVFGDAGWGAAANELLERFALIQCFSRVHYLAPDCTPGPGRTPDVELTRPSTAASIASGLPAEVCIGGSNEIRAGTSANGFAWAARRELLDRHGLFDACIIGGGDTAMIAAAMGCPGETVRVHAMNSRQQERYLAWARPFHESVQVDVGCLDGDLFHLWHGPRESRKRLRHEGLRPFQFDPSVDITMTADGCWQWNTPKHAMHDYVRAYFFSRQHDDR